MGVRLPIYAILVFSLTISMSIRTWHAQLYQGDRYEKYQIKKDPCRVL